MNEWLTDKRFVLCEYIIHLPHIFSFHPSPRFCAVLTCNVCRCTVARQRVTLSARSVRPWHMLRTTVSSSQACRLFCFLTRPTLRRISDWSRRSCVITQSEDNHWWKHMDLSSLLLAIHTESEISVILCYCDVSVFCLVTSVFRQEITATMLVFYKV